MTSTLPYAYSVNANSSNHHPHHDDEHSESLASYHSGDLRIMNGGNSFLPMQKLENDNHDASLRSHASTNHDASLRSHASTNHDASLRSNASTTNHDTSLRSDHGALPSLPSAVSVTVEGFSPNIMMSSSSQHSSCLDASHRSTASSQSINRRLQKMTHNKGQEKWRKQFITPQVSGTVVELGVTVENLPLYAEQCITSPEAADEKPFHLILVDARLDRLEEARDYAVEHTLADHIQCCHATDFRKLLPMPQNSADWIISTTASWSTKNGGGRLAMLGQINKCLRQGGKFRILDLVPSKNLFKRLGQTISKYNHNSNHSSRSKRGDKDDDDGTIDINILRYLKGHPDLSLDRVEYVHGDTHILIEGHKRTHKTRSRGSVSLSDVKVRY